MIRETLAQRRVPPDVVEYVTQSVRQAWRAVRTDLGRLRIAPQRLAQWHAASSASGSRAQVVQVDGVWQAALDFGFVAVREVAEDTLAVVSRLLRSAGVPFFVRDAASPGPIIIGIEVTQRRRVWDALAAVERDSYLYAATVDERPVPVPLWHVGHVPGDLVRTERVLLYRNHLVGNGYVVGASHGCVLEFWYRTGDNLRPPPGAQPARLVSSEVTPVQVVVGRRRYPTLSAFAGHRSLSAPAVPIDVVYTWIDDRDPVWRQRLAYTLARQDGELHPQAANASRYRDNDELRFSLRSLALYADFVRRVFVVTAGQVPEWLDVDHPDITIVDHTEILRPTHLPTFNSHAIEACLHHIDGLAEHYLYLNDDFILGRQVTAGTFFTANGLAKLFPDELAGIPPGPPSLADRPVDSASKNVRDLMRRDFGLHVGRKMLHAPYPQRRSVLAEMEQRFPDEFARTAASRFRHPTDVNVASCFAHYYAFATGRAVPGELTASYINLGSRWAALQMRRLLERRDRDAYCLNETDLDAARLAQAQAAARRFLAAYLPVPSPWERITPRSGGEAEERHHVGEAVHGR